jgi:hypothetical protein
MLILDASVYWKIKPNPYVSINPVVSHIHCQAREPNCSLPVRQVLTMPIHRRHIRQFIAFAKSAILPLAGLAEKAKVLIQDLIIALELGLRRIPGQPAE